jgi:Flp pilus assembly protein TadG
MRRASERGASAVEFALVLPLLFLILAGIIDLGRLMFYSAITTNVAREGARAAVVLDPSSSTYNPLNVETRAKAAGWGLEPARLTVTPPAACDGDNNLTVQVVYDMNWLILGPAMEMVGGSATLGDIGAHATMRCL